MIYIPIIGAIALAGATVFEKIVLRKRKLDIKLYQTASFLSIALLMIPLLFFFWKLDSQALEIKNIIIFFLVVIFSIIANLLVYYSMKWEKVTNIEPAKMFEPLFVIFLAVIFSFLISEELFERNMKFIIPALIAGGALIFSHIKKHHLDFNKYFLAAVAGSFFFALELILSKLILEFYSPITFYFLRCSMIFFISLAVFRPDFKKLNSKIKKEIFLIGIVWVVYRIVLYYGYLKYGVITTTLIFMLGPVFLYLLAWKFLNEKIQWRNIVATIIIIGSVLYATLA